MLVESGEPLPLACEPFGGLQGRHGGFSAIPFFFLATKTTRTAQRARTSDPGSGVLVFVLTVSRSGKRPFPGP